MNLSENCQKTDLTSIKAQFFENQIQNDHHKNFTNFRKIFGEFPVNFLLSVYDYDLNKYPTIFILHFSEVYLAKHAIPQNRVGRIFYHLESSVKNETKKEKNYMLF